MARNWANQYVRESKAGKHVHHSTYLTTPPEWLGPRFINDADHLKATNDTAYRHEYLGEVVGSGTQVFDNIKLERITNEQLGRYDYHYFGQDWGRYPGPNQFVGTAYDAKAKMLLVCEEYRGNRCSNADWAAKIAHHMLLILRLCRTPPQRGPIPPI